MAERMGPTIVRVFTAPEVTCGTGMTWAAAVGFIRDRLRRRFGEGVAVEHIEVFSERSFEFPAVLEAIQRGAQLPVVLVGDRTVSDGGKLSQSQIARAVEAGGVARCVEARRE